MSVCVDTRANFAVVSHCREKALHIDAWPFEVHNCCAVLKRKIPCQSDVKIITTPFFHGRHEHTHTHQHSDNSQAQMAMMWGGLVLSGRSASAASRLIASVRISSPLRTTVPTRCADSRMSGMRFSTSSSVVTVVSTHKRTLPFAPGGWVPSSSQRGVCSSANAHEGSGFDHDAFTEKFLEQVREAFAYVFLSPCVDEPTVKSQAMPGTSHPV